MKEAYMFFRVCGKNSLKSLLLISSVLYFQMGNAQRAEAPEGALPITVPQELREWGSNITSSNQTDPGVYNINVGRFEQSLPVRPITTFDTADTAQDTVQSPDSLRNQNDTRKNMLDQTALTIYQDWVKAIRADRATAEPGQASVAEPERMLIEERTPAELVQEYLQLARTTQEYLAQHPQMVLIKNFIEFVDAIRRQDKAQVIALVTRVAPLLNELIPDLAMTPLDLAIATGDENNQDIALILLEHGARPSQGALISLAQEKRMERVVEVLENRAKQAGASAEKLTSEQQKSTDSWFGSLVSGAQSVGSTAWSYVPSMPSLETVLEGITYYWSSLKDRVISLSQKLLDQFPDIGQARLSDLNWDDFKREVVGLSAQLKTKLSELANSAFAQKVQRGAQELKQDILQYGTLLGMLFSESGEDFIRLLQEPGLRVIKTGYGEQVEETPTAAAMKDFLIWSAKSKRQLGAWAHDLIEQGVPLGAKGLGHVLSYAGAVVDQAYKSIVAVSSALWQELGAFMGVALMPVWSGVEVGKEISKLAYDKAALFAQAIKPYGLKGAALATDAQERFNQWFHEMGQQAQLFSDQESFTAAWQVVSQLARAQGVLPLQTLSGILLVRSYALLKEVASLAEWYARQGLTGLTQEEALVIAQRIQELGIDAARAREQLDEELARKNKEIFGGAESKEVDDTQALERYAQQEPVLIQEIRKGVPRYRINDLLKSGPYIGGAYVNALSPIDGKTALQVALELGEKREDLINELLDAGALFMIKDNEGKTALDIARERNYSDIVTRIESIIRDNERLSSQQEMSALPEGLKQLFEQPFTEKFTELQYAVLTGDNKRVKDLLLRGVPLDTQRNGYTALDIALKVRDWDGAKLLLEAGASWTIPDKEGKTAFTVLKEYAAGPEGSEKELRGMREKSIKPVITVVGPQEVSEPARELYSFLQEIAQKRQRWLTPKADQPESVKLGELTELMVAAGRGDVNHVKELINQGVPLDTLSPVGKKTALHIAIERNKLLPALELIKAGASWNIPDEEGKTAQQRALEKGQLALLEAIKNYQEKYGKAELIRLTPEQLAQYGPLTKLMYASLLGDIVSVRNLLKSDIPLDTRSEKEGKTALYFAIEKYQPALAQLLVESGASWMINDNEGKTPYVLAQNTPGMESVLSLMDQLSKSREQQFVLDPYVQKSLNISDREITALMLAIIVSDDKNIADVKKLVLDGVPLNTRTKIDGNTALHFAIFMNKPTIARLLIQHGANWLISNSYGDTPEGVAKEFFEEGTSGMGDVLKAIQEQKERYARKPETMPQPRQDIESLNQLFEAVRTGDSNKVRDLIAAGVDVNGVLKGSTALHEAVQARKSALAKELLNAGASWIIKNNQNKSALELAKANNMRDVVAAMVSQAEKIEIPINPSLLPQIADFKTLYGSLTNLMIQSLLDNTEAINALSELGVDLNRQTVPGGYTALHLALLTNKLPAAQALLENGALWMIKDSKGRTALALAKQAPGAKSIIELIGILAKAREGKLIELTPEMATQLNVDQQLTPLMAAVLLGNKQEVERLIRDGVPLDTQSPRFNDTALHIAILANKPDMAILLLDAGADWTIENSENVTAQQLAQEDKLDTVLAALSRAQEKAKK